MKEVHVLGGLRLERVREVAEERRADVGEERPEAALLGEARVPQPDRAAHRQLPHQEAVDPPERHLEQ